MQQNPQDQNRPADVAAPDSVGGMAKRLMDPAHLKDLAGRSVRTLREQGLEQLWRDVVFRVGLAFHHDGWRHRADIPLSRTLRAQRAENLQGPCISVVVPVYNTPMRFFRQMVQSVQRQTYRNWQLVLMDASDAEHPQPGQLAGGLPKRTAASSIAPSKMPGIAANTTAGFGGGDGGSGGPAGPRRPALSQRPV